MAKQLFLNNFTTVFIAAVKETPTTGTPATELDYGVLRVSDGAAGMLLNPTGGDYYVLTAYKRSGSTESNIEVMRVTAVDNSTPGECRITVQRAQEGTTAQAYVSGDYLSLRFTKGSAENMVQKVAGKGLSTEDYTTAEKSKLAGIAAGAQVNAVTSVAGKTGAVTLAKVDVGLGSVDDTSDASKSVLSATKLTTARTLTIGSTGKSFDGSAALSWSLAEIGASSSSHTHSAFSAGQADTALNVSQTDAGLALQVYGASSTRGIRVVKDSADKAWQYSHLELYTPAGATTDFSRIAFHVQDVSMAPQVGFDSVTIGFFSSEGFPLFGVKPHGNFGQVVFTGGITEVRSAIGASDIDLRLGSIYTKTISGATVFTVSNVPAAGTTASFILDLTNGGSAAITWWSGVKWAGGTVPTMTAAGRDVLGFFTHDGGTTWTGLVLGKDVK